MENFFLLTLILVGGAGLFEKNIKYKVVYVSIGAGFLVFCGIVLWSVFAQFHQGTQLCHHNGQAGQVQRMANVHVEVSDNAQFRDSILEETQPLIRTTNTY